MIDTDDWNSGSDSDNTDNLHENQTGPQNLEEVTKSTEAPVS